MPDDSVHHVFGPQVIARSLGDAIFALGVMGFEDCLIFEVEMVEIIPTNLDWVKMN